MITVMAAQMRWYVHILVMTDVVQTSLGSGHTCAVKIDGSLWCWGRNDHGQLGDGTTEGDGCLELPDRRPCRTTPIQVNGRSKTGVCRGLSYLCNKTG